MSRVMNKLGWVLAGVLALLVVAAVARVTLGGPLDPPAAPASTQQNLIFQPANCAAFPIVLSDHGSYKLAQDIYMPSGCTKNGIEITGADLTLDLGGFGLFGVTGSLDGIAITSGTTRANIEIRNGTIASWGYTGIRLDDGLTNFAVNSRVDDVRVYGSQIGMLIGGSTTVTNSSIIFPACSGILALRQGNLISGNTIEGDAGGCGGSVGLDLDGDGNRAEGNVITGAGDFGIWVYGNGNTVIDNSLQGNNTTGGTEALRIDGDNNRIDSNTIDANGRTHAIFVNVSGTGNTITRNTGGNISGAFPADVFLIAAGNTSGPTQTNATPLGNPWANIAW